MPDPFAQPPMTTSRPSISVETATSFGCVSVVMIERAKRLPPSLLRFTFPRFCRTSAIGSSTPINPVLPMSTSSASTPRYAAARAVISSASDIPCLPTEQLAHPLLATTARALPLRIRRWLTVTDGDSTLFWLNIPAAVAGASDATIPRSSASAPAVLMPAYVPPAVNPSADATPPRCIN